MAQTWRYSPTRPEPEPCWTPYQKCGFSLDDSQSFPSSKSFWICLSPHNNTNSMTFVLKKIIEKLLEKESEKYFLWEKSVTYSAQTFLCFCSEPSVFYIVYLVQTQGRCMQVQIELLEKGLAGTHPERKHHQARLHSSNSRKKYTPYLFIHWYLRSSERFVTLD